MNSSKEETKLKIILLGDSGVGKTSLLNRYNGNDFKQLHNSTIFVDLITKELCIAEKAVILQIWDTAGQERFKSVESRFYRDTDCCVLVYDANPETPNNFPFVLVGNKTDINDKKPRVVAKEIADQWCGSKGNITYFETSAKEKTNVEEAFLKMAEKALSNEHYRPIYTPVYISTPVEEKPRSCSC